MHGRQSDSDGTTIGFVERLCVVHFMPNFLVVFGGFEGFGSQLECVAVVSVCCDVLAFANAS